MATINVSAGQSIQAAIDAASTGDVIIVAAGTYTETLNITKGVIIRGANAGVAGTDARGAETVIDGEVTINSADNVILNGLSFLLDDPFPASPSTADTYVAVTVLGSGADHQIKNSVFEASPTPGSTTPSSFLSGGSAPIYLGVELASVLGSVSIFNNLFTGANSYPYAGDVWRSAIFSNGGSGTTDINNNTFENVRTGINVDNFDDNVSIDGNSFISSGSGISVGVSLPAVVDNITNNSFDDVDTDLNFRNLSDPLVFDIATTGNSSSDAMLILGTTGDDDVTGSAGDDIFFSNGGEDNFDGGDGDDTMIATPLGGTGLFTGGEGEDRLIIPVTGNFNTVIVAPDEALSSFGITIDDDQLLIYSATGATQVVDASTVEFIEISKDPAVGGSDITFAGLSFLGDISGTGFDVNNILFASSGGSAPVAVNDAVTTDEDTPAFVNVLGNDTDADGDSVSIVQLGVPALGNASHSGGVVSYDPSFDFQYLGQGETATQTITYMITDDNSGFSLADIVFTITGVNDAPVTVDDTATTDEDTPIGINVLFNDSDADLGDNLTIQSVITSGAGFTTQGNVSFDANGLITYDPSGLLDTMTPLDTLTDRVDYVAVDGSGATSVGSLFITVTGVNDDPVANDDFGASYTVDAATLLSGSVLLPGNVLANDSDVDPGLSGLAVSGFTPFPGAMAALPILLPNGSLTVTAGDIGLLTGLGAGESRNEFFTYMISDGFGGTDTATVTITINGVNDAPITTPDIGTLNEDAGLVGFDVLANDTDPDTNDTLSIGTVSRLGGVGGIFSKSGDQITFDTNGDFDYLNVGDTAFVSAAYVVTDGTVGHISTLHLTINGVNDAPDAVDDSYAVSEDGSFTDDVTVNDSDVDSAGIAFLFFDTGAGLTGTLTEIGAGAFTYDTNGQFDHLAAGETATESFSYSIADSEGLVTTANVTITITGANDAPVAMDDIGGTTDEDSAFITGDVLANDSDVDTGDTISVSAFDALSAAGAAIIYNNDGTFTYDPNGQFESLAPGDIVTDVFSYTITDDSGATDTAVVQITISGVNDAPVAVDNATTMDEDTPSVTFFDVLANDFDPDMGQALNLISFNDTTTRGVLTYEGAARFTFETNGEFDDLAVGETETQSFTYTVEDPFGATDTATVTITVTGVNDDPEPVADDVATDEDTALLDIDVLANDSDPDQSDTLTIANVVTSAAAFTTVGLASTDGSTVSYDPNGQFEYLAQGETATDRFNYRVIDGNGGSRQAAVNVTITGVNDGPTAVDDFETVTENLSTLIKGVTVNDTDPDNGAILGLVSVDALSAQGHVVELFSSTGIIYRPDGAFNYLAVGETATDSFTYVVEDEFGATDTATVTVTFIGENDTPELVNDTAATDQDTALIGIDVLANDSDPDASDTLTIANVITSAAAYTTIGLASTDGSTVSYDPNGQFDYLAAGETAVDRFNYRAVDGNGGSSQAAVRVTVTGVNDGPTANNDIGATDEDNPSAEIDLLGNDTDPDNGAILGLVSIDAVSANGGLVSFGATSGTAIYDPNGQFEYLAVGETATDTFTYVMEDEFGATDTATVVVTITGVNDEPVVRADTATTDEDSAVFIDVLANDSDPDSSDTLEVFNVVTSSVLFATVGAVSFDAMGVTYDPNGQFDYLAAGETATDSFGVRVIDGNGGNRGARVDVAITGVNDGPTANDDTAATDEDTAIDIDVLANDTDVDNGAILSIVSVDATSAGGASLQINGDQIIYDPAGMFDYLAAGATTTDTFTYVMEDEFGATDTASVTVTITGVNDRPVAGADAVTTNEDLSVTINNLLSNDSDPEGDPLEIVGVVTSNANFTTQGTVTFNATNVTYDPGTAFNYLALDETATDVFRYRISDGNGGFTTGRVVMTIEGRNDDPTANDDSGMDFCGYADAPFLTGNVLLNDTDPDLSNTLEVFSFDAVSAAGALISYNNDGTFTYDPNGLFAGLLGGQSATDTFTYTVVDDNEGSDTATVTIIVKGPNTVPVANDDSDTTDEDTAVTIDLLANDVDPDIGAVLTITNIDDSGLMGSVTDNGDGTVTYDPSAAFQYLHNGETVTETFSYIITDDQGATDTATVSVTVTGINDRPVTGPDTATTDEDSAVTIDVLANDSDGDGDTLVINNVITSNAAFTTIGLVTFTSGDVTYDPNGQFDYLAVGETATDRFNYQINDGFGGFRQGRVDITITGVNDAPVAMDDSGATTEDGPTIIIDLLANDSDIDASDVLTIASIDDSLLLGSVIDNGDGTVTYDPGAGLQYLGDGDTAIETFTYTVSDGNGGTDTATVTITVTGANDEPVALPDRPSTDEDTPVNIDVLANDYDPDGDTLTISQLITNTASFTTIGTVTTDGLTVDYDPNGQFDYLAVGETAVDRFNYRVIDGNGGQDPAAVFVTITGVNDGPVAMDDSGMTTEDGPSVTIDLLANDSDIDASDVLSIAAIDDSGLLGSVIDNGDGTITYDPGAGFQSLGAGDTATETFSYTLSDGNGGTDTANVTITITGINDRPVAVRDFAITEEDSAVAIDVLANDFDVDGDALEIVGVITSNANFTTIGAVSFSAGDVTYDPNGQFEYLGVGETATDRFNYRISDGNGGFRQGRVDVTITGVNDNPDAMDDTGATTEDGPSIIVDLLANDTDIDINDVLMVTSIDDSGVLGIVTDNGDGTVTYDPGAAFQTMAAGDTATETFSYTVSDGNGGTDTANVTITITGVNDAPELANHSMHNCVGRGDTEVLTPAQLLATDIDAGTTPSDLVYTLTMLPALGVVALNGVALGLGDTFTQADIDNGLVSIVNLAGNQGDEDLFSFTVEDDQGAVIGPFDFDYHLGPPDGTPDDDILIGCPTDDVINGREAQDYIEGRGGNDTLRGQQGDDDIYGDGIAPATGPFGNDLLTGGQGQDTMLGGGGDDELRGGTGDDHMYGDYQVFSDEDGMDTLFGGNNNDHMFGGGGDDILRGNAGDDWLWGDLQSGPDAREGNDSLYGGADQDRLFGGGGNDRLFGGDGHDYLYGGAGADRMTGGDGKDVFVINAGEADGDRITDFAHLVDTIELHGFGAGASIALSGASEFTITYNGGASMETITIDGMSSLTNQDVFFF